MSIVKITGPAKSGKSTTANALRAYYLNQGRGVLLLDASSDEATSADLLAKLVRERRGDQVAWKPDPVIIMVGDRDRRLADFDKLAPGFVERLSAGGVFSIATAGVAAAKAPANAKS